MVSNKTLAMFILVAVIISLGGTLISLNKLQQISELKRLAPTKVMTGMASLGKVELEIQGNTSCAIVSNVSFGAAGKPSSQITISTNSDNTGTNFYDCLTNDACKGMVINNTGSTNINVSFYSSVNGSTLLKGPGASNDDFVYAVFNGGTEGEEPGCIGTLKNSWGPVDETETIICSNMSWISTNRLITVEYNITIDQDTPPELKTAQITVNCGLV